MGRQHYRGRHEGIRRKHQHIKRRRNNGWGMGLYRNTRTGKIAGVCAGLADYWDVDNWVVRLLAIAAFLFTGSLAFWAYIAGWILLAPRRRAEDMDAWSRLDDEEREDIDLEYDERAHDYRPRRMFRYGESASVRLQRARERLDAALRRVEDMESYVTSRQFELNRKISEL
ncbi:MAG: PspC domain-containing protein [Halieaceae bacterium]|jgi:phage shock protein C|nr:PspC domain-containing protein [Halieaceae bacterium]